MPAMAKQLGLEVWQNNAYYQNEKSAIPFSDWMTLLAYYDSLAPEKLTAAKPELANSNNPFEILIPKVSEDLIATTTLVAIDSVSHSIYTSNSETATLDQWNNHLQKGASRSLPSPAVNILFTKNENPVVTAIGEMKALDNPVGEVFRIKSETNIPIANHLLRPIQTVSADFNNDGLADYLTASFGHNRGGLFLSTQQSDHTFKTTPVREIAGATQSITGDFNNDGWMDFMTLFAHADEGIWLFTNDKKGGFSNKNILRFPPVYGSSSFQIADINKDGKPDIIYTAGDNSDYSRILKPYHGLYVFTNTGNMSFKQSFFYPINGATKVIAADIDLDGDVDLASIAFFADLKNNSPETFTWFENKSDKGSIQLQANRLPLDKKGRWICMDLNDIDGDGDMDIVLGNYSKGFLNEDNFHPDWNTNIPFLVLKNKTR